MLPRALSLLGLAALTLSRSFVPPPPQSFGVIGENATFDYVVIGGGTAGLVMAARLSQGGRSVAIVEAGGFYEQGAGNISTIPSNSVWYAGAAPNDTDPAIDWGFVTAPQAGVSLRPSGQGMANRRLHYARGKCLGGSSARNYFTYMRATRQAYERWAREVDDPGYSLDQFALYMQRSIHFTPADNEQRAPNASVPDASDAFCSSDGPLQVSIPPWANPFSSFVKRAWEQLGIPPIRDFVTGRLQGVQYNMNTIDPADQSRSSSESAFLQLALTGGSSRLYNQTLAHRILFEGTTATAVLVQTDGIEYVLSARKEVILSAGAFQSPQLLMLSGIGPAATLQQHEIPVVSALPGVGQNMWDHLLFGLSYRVTPLTHSALSNTNGDTLASASAAYHANQTGLLTNPGGDLIAWEKLPAAERAALSPATQAALAQFPADWPELEYLVLDAYSGNNENYITATPPDDDTAHSFMYASPSAVLVAPLSRGSVTITSRHATDPPLINPNWLTHRADQELAIAAFRRLRAMMATEIMQSVTVAEVYPPLPGSGSGNLTSDSDDEILDTIRRNAIMTFHASCTCKMGRRGDPMAVVDAQGRVFGTEGLRVVDASAMPFLPPGHPQGSIYGLAEKIADDIIRGNASASI
ncbi:glucose-methanol-choline oxidoreductase [Aspergillus heteromorphus CBS 117.55]|uniref:Glucose-methanol-choline oxidoreductase n=1 Tax=Aspergillus heteromorphus CBS 117.55 TaxID=1448321 RepID=A0A317W7I0_9EURO|nr:glucose-methanol-choline oxidoreductase [Aspergillus heteromorphus CBS 117.55]PWY82039.1 glucose-methanol-choline oxidoreductase [Aspergillus heteromorphus CBS 117.55]